jgi:hypothetical protein
MHARARAIRPFPSEQLLLAHHQVPGQGSVSCGCPQEVDAIRKVSGFQHGVQCTIHQGQCLDEYHLAQGIMNGHLHSPQINAEVNDRKVQGPVP